MQSGWRMTDCRRVDTSAIRSDRCHKRGLRKLIEVDVEAGFGQKRRRVARLGVYLIVGGLIGGIRHM